MAYELPPLPYDYDALEPHIDEQTMQIHHDKHHADLRHQSQQRPGRSAPIWPTCRVEAVDATDLNSVPEDIRTAVRNNGGGHANHTMFWQIMGPNGGGQPSGALAEAINQTLRRLRRVQGADRQGRRPRASAAAGPGWSSDGGGKLAVESTPNQDSPLMEGSTPILGVDVWEHAYYLKYQNRRPDYMAAWWNIVNWRRGGQALSAGPLEGLPARGANPTCAQESALPQLGKGVSCAITLLCAVRVRGGLCDNTHDAHCVPPSVAFIQKMR